MLEKFMNAIMVGLEEYQDLINRSEKLAALETGGVENWVGYDIAMENYHTAIFESFDEIEGD